jgi:CheY-like chemotaxis protein
LDEDSITESMRILIIEDNTDAASTLCKLPELRGYVTRMVTDSLKAVEAAKAFRPQVILMDVAMPGQDGYVTTELLRQSRELHDPFIVVVSGYCRESNRSAALEAGADEFLAKPVSLQQVETVVATALHRAIGC